MSSLICLMVRARIKDESLSDVSLLIEKRAWSYIKESNEPAYELAHSDGGLVIPFGKQGPRDGVELRGSRFSVRCQFDEIHRESLTSFISWLGHVSFDWSVVWTNEAIQDAFFAGSDSLESTMIIDLPFAGDMNAPRLIQDLIPSMGTWTVDLSEGPLHHAMRYINEILDSSHYKDSWDELSLVERIDVDRILSKIEERNVCRRENHHSSHANG
ncbi:MAG: hypothetical protein EOO88_18690 [Pedobacter sp.]|nr:MAG: hypothetical protein EOO88_18690 [Pedobacter sp.]